MKWLWRYNIKKQALWRQVISCRYEQLGHWGTKPLRTIIWSWQLEIHQESLGGVCSKQRVSRWEMGGEFHSIMMTGLVMEHRKTSSLIYLSFQVSSSPNATIEEAWG